jgi:hypothetical protein
MLAEILVKIMTYVTCEQFHKHIESGRLMNKDRYHRILKPGNLAEGALAGAGVIVS